MSDKKGKIYLVATPIGNLDDMTYRAIETLKNVDLVAAEDTRVSKRLLTHFGIDKPMLSYHAHNYIVAGKKIEKYINEGKDIAVISDAGTPCISDPGEELVRWAVENGVERTIIPGASAVISALAVSGLSTLRFVFEGFLPVQTKERKERLLDISNEQRTIILYEAPHRILDTLRDLKRRLGDRSIVIVRELTKRYEEIQNTTISEALKYYEENSPRGEYVLIVEGKSPEEVIKEKAMKWDDTSIEDHLNIYLKEGLKRNEAIKKVATDRNLSRKEVYDYISEVSNATDKAD